MAWMLKMVRPAAASLAAACLSGQAPPTTYQATTRLVEFTVVTLDKKGNPVENLTKEDFTVLDNGKPREIAFFRHEGGRGPAVAVKPLPPREFSNRVEFTGGPPRGVTALVLDAINTEPNDQMFVKAQGIQFLRALAPQTRVAVFQLAGSFRVLHDFTDDMDSLREQIKKVSVQFPARKPGDVELMARQADELIELIEGAKSPYRQRQGATIVAAQYPAIAGEVNSNSNVLSSRAHATLGTLEALGRHIAGIPGRKSVVWISGGIAVAAATVSTREGRVNPVVAEQFQQAIRRTAERLAQAGVALYAVDAHGLVSGAENLSSRQYMPPVRSRYEQLEQADSYSRDPRAAFSIMTSVTGGRYFFNMNDFSEGIRKASNDLAGSYSIGFYATGEADGAWHTLKVVTRRQDIDLLHRQGYFSEAIQKASKDWGGEQLRAAMMNPLGSSSVHMNAHTETPAGLETGTLSVTLHIEPADLQLREEEGTRHGEIEVTFGEKSVEGKVTYEQAVLRVTIPRENWEMVRTQGIPYTRTWKPGPYANSIRVLVRDTATGQYGTLDMPIARAF